MSGITRQPTRPPEAQLPLKSSCGLSVWTIAALILAQIGCDPFCCYMYHVYPT